MGRTRPICLTIAGFDPSGGAGVLADCKTFESIKTLGLSVITANTIQTEDSFQAYHWISKEIILAQLETLMTRYSIGFVKIGLIENTSILLEVLEMLSKKPKIKIVWDPILSPTFGKADETRFSSEIKAILSKIDYITPNVLEYKALFGETEPEFISSENKVGIFLKGGHAEQKGKDYFYINDKVYPLRPKVVTQLEKHGTGCILSSAFIAFLSRDFPVIKSARRAKDYVEKRIISNNTRLAYHK
jgi:hydroxymethylpyrimidine/phosphomethylpyrimidine kinase